MSEGAVEPRADPFRPWRELRPEEEKVQFLELASKIERSTIRFHVTLRRILEEVEEDVIRRALQLENPRVWSQLKELTIFGSMRDYRRFLSSFFVDVYSFSKAAMAQELEVPIPGMSDEFTAWVESKTQALTSLHTAVLDFRLRSVAQAAPLTPAEKANFIRRGMSTVIDSFSRVELPRGGELVSVLSVQAGREETLRSVYHEVVSFTWTAILDERVCSVCRALDGITWARDDPSIIWPPIHLHDRCLMIAILEKSAYKPEITGLPEGFKLPKEYLEFTQSLARFGR